VLSSFITSNTRRIKLGSSIYPISTRTSFQIAMATGTLNELSNGRIGFIGLGIGYKARIEQYFGLKLAKPITKMKEYTEIIKGLLSGEEFSYKGNFFDFQDFPKLVPEVLNIPILFGSSGDKNARAGW
jgi:alkanesulfonate monooxygenase SsuD/methylene tetrahydromethanopterin reductase-like flavin-dependent oxidoreductase (luciferase family)